MEEPNNFISVYVQEVCITAPLHPGIMRAPMYMYEHITYTQMMG